VTSGSNALDGSDIEIEAAARKLPLKIIAPEFGLRFSYLADAQSLARMLLDGELDVCSLDRHLHEMLARDLWAYEIAAARPARDTLLR
jgi:hypothetical protein